MAGIDRLRPWSAVTITVGPPVLPDPPRWWSTSRQVLKVVDRVRRSILTAFDQGQRARAAHRGFWRRFRRRRPETLPAPT
jgi:hypothetical protein